MHLPILSGIKFRTLGLMACLLAPVLGLAEAKVGILFHEQDSYWKFAATLLEQNANDKKLSATAKALPQAPRRPPNRAPFAPSRAKTHRPS